MLTMKRNLQKDNLLIIEGELFGMILLERASSTNLYTRGMVSALPPWISLWVPWIVLDGACLGAVYYQPMPSSSAAREAYLPVHLYATWPRAIRMASILPIHGRQNGHFMTS